MVIYGNGLTRWVGRATLGWNFNVGSKPVSARLKYFHEFGVRNRAEGDALFLTFSVPISIAQ